MFGVYAGIPTGFEAPVGKYSQTLLAIDANDIDFCELVQVSIIDPRYSW